jgi:hypothetical protein
MCQGPLKCARLRSGPIREFKPKVNEILIDKGYVFFTIHKYLKNREKIQKSAGEAIIKAVETGKFAAEYKTHINRKNKPAEQPLTAKLFPFT